MITESELAKMSSEWWEKVHLAAYWGLHYKKRPEKAAAELASLLAQVDSGTPPGKSYPPDVEEDGDEVFTPIPETCHCGGTVKIIDGYHKCEKCRGSYGKVQNLLPPPTGKVDHV